MASLDEIIQALGTVEDEIDDALRAASTADDETDDFHNAMVAADVEDKAEGARAIKDGIEGLIAILRNANDKSEEIRGLAEQLKG